MTTKIIRKIIKIDEEKCNGCGNCIISCAEGAIELVNGIAHVIHDKYCDGLGACLGECPQDALEIIEREAEEFDEQAVEALLKGNENKPSPKENNSSALPCGCPSSHLKTFDAAGCGIQVPESLSLPDEKSALTHWPVQLRLIPPHAPFLQGADLLVVADCTSIAYPNFHRDFIRGRVVLMGCPKFDNQEMYQEKFTETFSRCDIKSVTIVVMEVPCCQGMPHIVRSGMDSAGVKIPCETAIISAEGAIVKRTKDAA